MKQKNERKKKTRHNRATKVIIPKEKDNNNISNWHYLWQVRFS